MLDQDGVVAVRTGRDDMDRHAGDLLDAAQVGLGVDRQVLVAGGADRGFGPARQRLVDRLAARDLVGAIGSRSICSPSSS